jgi:hypothetical protein
LCCGCCCFFWFYIRSLSLSLSFTIHNSFNLWCIIRRMEKETLENFQKPILFLSYTNSNKTNSLGFFRLKTSLWTTTVQRELSLFSFDLYPKNSNVYIFSLPLSWRELNPFFLLFCLFCYVFSIEKCACNKILLRETGKTQTKINDLCFLIERVSEWEREKTFCFFIKVL